MAAVNFGTTTLAIKIGSDTAGAVLVATGSTQQMTFGPIDHRPIPRRERDGATRLGTHGTTGMPSQMLSFRVRAFKADRSNRGEQPRLWVAY